MQSQRAYTLPGFVLMFLLLPFDLNSKSFIPIVHKLLLPRRNPFILRFMSSRPPSSTSLDHSTSQETHGEPKDTTTTSPSTLSAEKLKKLPSQVPEAENVLDHPNPSNGNGNEPTYPGPLALGLLMLGICLAAFLVALDRTIVATAIPSITDEFKSPSDVGWYGSAYLLTSCAFQPTYGRVFAHFDVRWSFLGSLGLFELGSLVCGVAPSSKALIVGRAIAGLGSAGIFAGSLVIITLSVPLTKRPVYTAAVGSMYEMTIDFSLLSGNTLNISLISALQ